MLAISFPERRVGVTRLLIATEEDEREAEDQGGEAEQGLVQDLPVVHQARLRTVLPLRRYGNRSIFINLPV